jgi:hypothetical protein
MRSKPEPSPYRRADGTVNLDVEKKIVTAQVLKMVRLALPPTFVC